MHGLAGLPSAKMGTSQSASLSGKTRMNLSGNFWHCRKAARMPGLKTLTSDRLLLTAVMSSWMKNMISYCGMFALRLPRAGYQAMILMIRASFRRSRRLTILTGMSMSSASACSNGMVITSRNWSLQANPLQDLFPHSVHGQMCLKIIKYL